VGVNSTNYARLTERKGFFSLADMMSSVSQ
jgi:hypothetical protein